MIPVDIKKSDSKSAERAAIPKPINEIKAARLASFLVRFITIKYMIKTNMPQQERISIMPFIKVLRHGQVTVPKKYRKIFGIKEGDVLEVKVQKNGVLLEPKILVNKNKELFK